MQNFGGILKEFVSKNFIVLVMWGLLTIIGALLVSDFSKSPTVMLEQISPYVLSTKGETLILHEKQLTKVVENSTGSISAGDRVKTQNSTATIFWPDGSITRLAEESSITIHELQAKSISENIQIDFSLERGKSWSNVIRYYFGDSYFHERFNNDSALAAVRGTVFEINLDNKYIHAIDHAITIEDIGSHSGSVFVVAGGILDTETRTKLIQDKLDATWNAINTNADIVYLNNRMAALQKAIIEAAGQKNYLEIALEKIGLRDAKSPLEILLNGDSADWEQFKSGIMKGEDSKKLMNLYQQVYGLQNTEALLNTKIKLRDLILQTASSNDKPALLTDFARSTLYDSWNAALMGTGMVEDLQNKLQEYLKQGADKKLIDSLRDASTEENIINLNNTIQEMKKNALETLGKEDLLKKVTKEVNIENVEKINKAADTARNGFIEWLKSLFQ